MKFTITKEALFPAVRKLSGVIGGKQAIPILSNMLLKITPDSVSMTATDLEVELVVVIEESFAAEGEITLSVKKLQDICRTLPEGVQLEFEIKEGKASIRSGKSRFVLSTLPAEDFPEVEMSKFDIGFTVERDRLRKLIENTHFAMAQDDVRFFLNGLLLEVNPDFLRCVATDGHRLALGEIDLETGVKETIRAIIPKKGVAELMRLLDEGDEKIGIKISDRHIRAEINSACFTSKLIDGKFPDYQRVIPKPAEHKLVSDREEMKQSLTRVSILSNWKYHGVRITLNTDQLSMFTRNPEQEEAEEELDVKYQGEELEMEFNVSYLLETLTAIDTDNVVISIAALDGDAGNGRECCLILPEGESRYKYVIMPMGKR